MVDQTFLPNKPKTTKEKNYTRSQNVSQQGTFPKKLIGT
jgi:hypothetical protein